MGYRLCTAEKPSAAQEIANAVGANERKDGYFIGNGYIVTWAYGHLVTLVEPEEYGYVNKDDMWDKEQPHMKAQAYAELPLFPEQFKLGIIESSKKQFEIIKELMHRADVDLIVDCGDMGSEGHILQWLIRVMAKCNKPVKRFCDTSLTPDSIRRNMDNLRDISEFDNIIKGEYCKKRADWIMGMSMSRCGSIKFNARVDVGRVQSPTLFFVVKRYMDVLKFKVVDYYQLELELIEGFKVYWLKDADNRVAPSEKDHDNRLLNKATADRFASDILNNRGCKITKLDFSKKGIDRPQLYDITELQRMGNRLFGYSAAEVLEIAQSLYETHKILSYPRTDSRYLTTDVESHFINRIKWIAEIPTYTQVGSGVLNKGLNIDKKIVNNEQVSDHHALIVTDRIKGFDFSRLNQKELKILDLVISRMLVSVSHKYIYDETVINVSASNGMTFAANGKKPIDQGWKVVHKALMGKDVEDDDSDEQGQLFPNLQVGQAVTASKVNTLAKKTTPPKLHTEDTLLTAMENAGSQVANGSILKGKGIGTQSTRGNIIKSLFDKKYVTNKQVGKTNYLVPTKQGISTIKVLPSDLYSPKITADWEEKIALIAKGQFSEQQFMQEFKGFIVNKVNEVKASNLKVDFTFEKEVFETCPFCKGNIYETQVESKYDKGKKIDAYFCSNKCGFYIQKDNVVFVARVKKNLTTAQIRKLITARNFSTSSCISKTNTKYAGTFKLVKQVKGDKVYAALEFEIDKSKKSSKSIGLK